MASLSLPHLCSLLSHLLSLRAADGNGAWEEVRRRHLPLLEKGLSAWRRHLPHRPPQRSGKSTTSRARTSRSTSPDVTPPPPLLPSQDLESKLNHQVADVSTSFPGRNTLEGRTTFVLMCEERMQKEGVMCPPLCCYIYVGQQLQAINEWIRVHGWCRRIHPLYYVSRFYRGHYIGSDSIYDFASADTTRRSSSRITLLIKEC